MVCHSLGGAVGGRIMHSILPLGTLRSGCWFVATLYLFLLIAPTAHACGYFQQLLLFSFSLAPGDVRQAMLSRVKVPANLTGTCPSPEPHPKRMEQSADSDMSEGGGRGADAHTAVTQKLLVIVWRSGKASWRRSHPAVTSVMNRTKPQK